MGKVTISLSKWIALSSLHEARSINQAPGSNSEAAPVAAAAAVGGNVTPKDARLAYTERAVEVALLLLNRLRNHIESSSSQKQHRSANDSSSATGGGASILSCDMIAIDNFAVDVEFEDNTHAAARLQESQMQRALQNQNSHHHDRREGEHLELWLIADGTPSNINVSNSFRKVDNEDQIIMQSESDAHYFESVGLLLYKIFCRGENLPHQLESNNGASDQPSRSMAESTAHKKVNKAGNRSYKQLFSKYDLPHSICRFLSDLIQTGEAPPENPFESLSDISLELKQMSEQPDQFLHSTNTMMEQPNFGEAVYGRSAELHSLIQVAARLPVERNPLENKIVLITGPSGSGKSFLVNSAVEPLSNWGFMHISAKFDRLAQHSPLPTIASAFDEFFAFIAGLRRDQEQVDERAEDIVTCMERDLGASGIVVLSNLVPSIRGLFPHILRRVVSDPDLSALDGRHNQPTHNLGQGNIVRDEEDAAPSAEFSRNRLHYLFRRLVNAISSPEHPICLYFDDLQWMDRSSMDLISSLLLDFDHLDHFGNMHAPSQCFFVVGTYRDNEVIEYHTLASFLEKLEGSNSVVVSNINLGGMPKDCVNLMISKALQLPLRLTRTLADATMAKTTGNPFHVKAFVKALVQENVLHWSLLEKRWVWDIEDVRAISIDENVAELLARNLLQLPDFVREALKVASCFGSEISESIVKRLSSSKEWECLVDGLNAAASENILEKQHRGRYKFVHDSLQEVSYNLMDEEECSKHHYSIGMHLISSMPQPEDPDFSSVSFNAIGQINRAKTFTKSGAFSVQFAILNLKAGKRSMEVSDFASALSYMECGRAFLLEEAGWEENYELCLCLCESAALVCFILALVDKMKVFLKDIFEHANCLEDKLKGYYMLIRSMAAFSLNEAIEKALSILSALGEEFPDPSDITPVLIRKELVSTNVILEDLTREDVLTPRRMSEASKRFWSVKYMALIIMFLAVGRPRYLPLVASRMIKISASHGYINDSAFAFIVFGQALIGLAQDLDNGYRLGKMALALLEGLNAKDARPRVKWWFCSMLAFWKEPIQAISPVIQENIDESLKVGDNEYAVLSWYTLCRNNIFSGKNLSSTAKEIALATSVSLRLQQLNMQFALISQHLILLKLMGSDQDPFYGAIPIKNENELLHYVVSEGKTATARVLYLNKMFLAFWFKNYEEAADMAAKCDSHGVFSYVDVVMYTFYKGLTSFHLARGVDDDSEKHLESGRKALLSFQVWVKEKQASTWNFQHKLYILEAEWHFFNGELDEAEERYAVAIETARKHRFVNEEGLANELFSNFHTANGNVERAKSHILEARACYEKWGALALVNLIDDEINN